MYFRFLLFFFLITSCFGAEETSTQLKLNTDLANYESEPSAMVGPVNVITGDLVAFERDIMVAGPVPLSMDRSKDNSGYDGLLDGGWNHNWCGELSYRKKYSGHTHRHYNISYDGPHGEELGFEAKPSREYVVKIPIKPVHYQYALTNCAAGEISGRTNLKNFSATLDRKSSECTLRKGDGTTLLFKKLTDKKCDDYLIEKEILPNLNQISYEYEKYKDKDGEKNYRLIQVTTHNRKGKPLTWIKFKNSENFKKDCHHRVFTSDGRTVAYSFEAHFGKRDYDYEDPTWAMNHVYRPDSILTFEHAKHKYVDGWVARQSLGDTFLNIEYFVDEEYFFPDGEKIKIKEKEDYRVKKVFCLTAPLGKDQTPHVQYKFRYDAARKKDFKDQGSTHVWDASNHKTTYHHEKMRLKAIERYEKDNQTLHTKESFEWGDEESTLNCNLVKRSLADINGFVVFQKNYTYDANHNVTEEITEGHICGNEANDKLVKSSRYSDDGMNLLLWQKEGRNTTSFTYYPNSNLIKSRIQKGDEGLCQRTFYDYDDSAVMTLEIIDNGKGTAVDDLKGVTQRTIRRIEPTELGFPATVTYAYLNDQNQECLLRKEINEFNKLGKMVRQEVYDTQNRLAYTLKWKYDEKGNLIYEKNALGQVIEREYDDRNNLVKEIGPDKDAKKAWEYDFMNRVVCFKEGKHSTHYTYDRKGNRTKEIDLHGNTTQYIYNCHNHLIATVLPDGTKLRKKYGLLDRLTEETDGKGNTTHYHNTVFGKVYLQEFPDGSKETTEYDLQSLPIKKVERNGLVTLYSYDSAGRVTSELTGGVKKRKYRYNAFHLLSETDPSGLITTYQYDRAGRKIALQRAGYLEQYEYDTLGRLFKTITPSQIFEKTYDNLDRIVAEKAFDQDGNLLSFEEYIYDASGRKTHILTHSENGVTTDEKHYNTHGELIWHKDALGQVTHYTYNHKHSNELGQRVLRTEKTDPMGRRLVTTYDVLGRVETVEQFNLLGKTIQKSQYSYDANGNSVQAKEFLFVNDQLQREIIHAWEYDPMNQLTSITEGVGTPEQKVTRYVYNTFGQKVNCRKPDGQPITYKYDAFGRLESLTSSDVDYHYSYNLLDKPTKIEDRVHGTLTERTYNSAHDLVQEKLANGLTVEYERDTEGRTTELVLPNAGSIRYSYMGPYLKEVIRVSPTQSYKASYSYTLTGAIKTLQLPFGIAVSYEYDPLLRLLSQSASNWKETITGYDALGNLLGLNYSDGHSQSFTFDALNQLSSENQQTYRHDSLYNLIELSHSYNALNQPTHLHYDKNGNLLEKDGVHLRYDTLDRLIEVEQDGVKTTYTYDAFNRRMTSNEKQFIYKEDDEIGLIENNQLPELRILGTGLQGDIGAAVAFEINDQLFIPIHDHRGNTAALFDSSGKQVAIYHYSAFGMLDSEPEFACPWLFSSKRLDPETSLYYFGERFYDPFSHRWITADPLQFDDGPNLYAYVHNNPLTHLDPHGLWAQDLLDGFSRGFVDDSSWGLSNLALGEYKYTGLSSQLGYYAGSGTSMAAGLWYGGTQAKMCYYGGKLAAHSLPSFARFASEHSPSAIRFTEGTLNTTTSFFASSFNQAKASVQAVGSKCANVFQQISSAKIGLSNAELVQKAATKAERAIGKTGRFAGTEKHSYATKLLERYQKIFGDRGLDTNVYFNNNRVLGPGNRGFLDVLDNTNGIIYDFKFGQSIMKHGQYEKYSRNFEYPIHIIRP